MVVPELLSMLLLLLALFCYALLRLGNAIDAIVQFQCIALPSGYAVLSRGNRSVCSFAAPRVYIGARVLIACFQPLVALVISLVPARIGVKVVRRHREVDTIIRWITQRSRNR